MSELSEKARSQTKPVEVGVKIYLDGFPKSGLHMLNLMAACIAIPMLEKNWLGNLQKNSWGRGIGDQDRFLKVIDLLPPGQFIKGHCAYTPEVEQRLNELGAAMVFLYRDLRDVTISQAFHILHENDDQFVHPGKDQYRALDSFEDVLIAVIEGIGEYPGIFERWKMFEPWFDVPWVMKLSYESMREDTEKTADRFCRYVYHRTISALGYSVELNEDDIQSAVKAIVAATKRTELSPTFRKGIVGNYKSYFTPRVQQCFDEHAGDWLKRMKYDGNRKEN